MSGECESKPDEEVLVVSYLQLALVFGRIGLLSFGGGLSAWVYREVVARKGWLKETEFLGALTLCQILPGSNVVNLAVYVGRRLRGAAGSLVAVLSLLLPPVVLVILSAQWVRSIAHIDWLHALLEGVAAAAIGMTASVGIRTARVLAATNPWSLCLVLAVFVCVGILRWPLVPVAGVAGLVGVGLAWKLG